MAIMSPKEKREQLSSDFESQVEKLLGECEGAIERSDTVDVTVRLGKSGTYSEKVIKAVTKKLKAAKWKVEHSTNKSGALLLLTES